LKLGGSIITRKGKPLTPDTRMIAHLAKEIQEAAIRPLIIIHGGGSFGHHYAKEYDLAKGYKNIRQLTGLSKTHQAMVALNKLVVDALIQRGIPAIAVQPSAFILTRSGRICDFNGTLLLRMLNLNLVPVLYGDAVLDEELEFTILSGDQLVATLAVHFESKRIILCVDVDGLFTSDPKLDPHAKLIRRISLSELKSFHAEIGHSLTVDVTGGMYGKIAALIPILEKGVGVKIINGKKTNRLYKALMNQEVKGTKIEP
jgi:isopentenyl phosphate kinase